MVPRSPPIDRQLISASNAEVPVCHRLAMAVSPSPSSPLISLQRRPTFPPWRPCQSGNHHHRRSTSRRVPRATLNARVHLSPLGGEPTSLPCATAQPARAQLSRGVDLSVRACWHEGRKGVYKASSKHRSPLFVCHPRLMGGRVVSRTKVQNFICKKSCDIVVSTSFHLRLPTRSEGRLRTGNVRLSDGSGRRGLRNTSLSLGPFGWSGPKRNDPLLKHVSCWPHCRKKKKPS